MIAVNLQEPASTVKRYFKDNDLSFLALLDSKGEIGTRFGIRSIPTTVILDKTGRMIGGAFGPRKWDSRKSVDLFEYLINTG
jgi:hypothetical protein